MTPLRRRMSAKNQVAIPVVLLKRYRIQPQGEVTFEAHEDGILLKPSEDPIARLRGMLKGKIPSSLEIKEEMRREEREHERRKFGL